MKDIVALMEQKRLKFYRMSHTDILNWVQDKFYNNLDFWPLDQLDAVVNRANKIRKNLSKGAGSCLIVDCENCGNRVNSSDIIECCDCGMPCCCECSEDGKCADCIAFDSLPGIL